MNRIEISNMALNAIGARPIVSLTDESSQEAKTMALLYSPTMEQVLSMHSWPSLMARARIAESVQENLSAWQYMYQLPNNCVSVLTMLSEDFLELDKIESIRKPKLSDMAIFEREGTFLLSNVSPGIIKYIHMPEDSEEMRELLGETVAMMLAHKAAIRLGRDANLTQQLSARFNNTFIAAKMAEDRDRRSDPIVKKDWTQFRGAGRRRLDDWVPTV